MRKEIDIHCSQDAAMQALKRKLNKESSAASGNRFLHRELSLENVQKMILGGIPRRSLDDAAKYWQMIRETKAALMITLNSNGQWDQAKPFWKKKLAENLGLPITRKSVEVLYKSDKKITDKIDHQEKQVFVKIVKKTFDITDEQGLTHQAVHLHYKHWPDHSRCPDLDALVTLLRERQAIVKDKSSPIVINCQGGVGRTGEMALLEFALNLLENQEKQGIGWDKMTLNIAELIYQMRKSQPTIIGSTIEQIQQVCHLLSRPVDETKLVVNDAQPLAK